MLTFLFLEGKKHSSDFLFNPELKKSADLSVKMTSLTIWSKSETKETLPLQQYLYIQKQRGRDRIKISGTLCSFCSVWITTQPIFYPIFSTQGKQSVLIKDWINPQSDSFSVNQLLLLTLQIGFSHQIDGVRGNNKEETVTFKRAKAVFFSNSTFQVFYWPFNMAVMVGT